MEWLDENWTSNLSCNSLKVKVKCHMSKRRSFWTFLDKSAMSVRYGPWYVPQYRLWYQFRYWIFYRVRYGYSGFLYRCGVEMMSNRTYLKYVISMSIWHWIFKIKGQWIIHGDHDYKGKQCIGFRFGIGSGIEFSVLRFRDWCHWYCTCLISGSVKKEPIASGATQDQVDPLVLQVIWTSFELRDCSVFMTAWGVLEIWTFRWQKYGNHPPKIFIKK